MNKLYGTGVALVTPFNTDGSVDFEGLKNYKDIIKYSDGINDHLISTLM